MFEHVVVGPDNVYGFLAYRYLCAVVGLDRAAALVNRSLVAMLAAEHIWFGRRQIAFLGERFFTKFDVFGGVYLV